MLRFCICSVSPTLPTHHREVESVALHTSYIPTQKITSGLQRASILHVATITPFHPKPNHHTPQSLKNSRSAGALKPCLPAQPLSKEHPAIRWPCMQRKLLRVLSLPMQSQRRLLKLPLSHRVSIAYGTDFGRYNELFWQHMLKYVRKGSP